MGMTSRFIRITIFFSLGTCLVAAGCGTTPMGTRTVEERFLDQGYANRMYDYGLELFGRGRLVEAHAAFLQAETSAYPDSLKFQSRRWRMYLEEVIAAHKEGRQPPPPPMTPDEVEEARVAAAKAREEEQERQSEELRKAMEERQAAENPAAPEAAAPAGTQPMSPGGAQ